MQDKKPRPVGRPAFRKGHAKSEVLKMRVQPRERAIYERAAKTRGVDLSTWMRDSLNQCASKNPGS